MSHNKPSKKIEEFFDDIVPYEDTDEFNENDSEEEFETSNDRNTLLERMSNLDKVELALDKVSRLDELDGELDSIATEALNAYSGLYDRAGQFADAHAGKAYESAVQFLRVALDAKGKKLDRKLKTIEMQLKKARLDHDMSKQSSEDDESDKGMSRTELLSALETIVLSEDDFGLNRQNARGSTE